MCVQECLKGAGIVAVTINATCGHADDEKMLIDIIQKKEGGFNALDAVVRDFRLSQLPRQVQEVLADAQNVEVQTAKMLLKPPMTCKTNCAMNVSPSHVCVLPSFNIARCSEC